MNTRKSRGRHMPLRRRQRTVQDKMRTPAKPHTTRHTNRLFRSHFGCPADWSSISEKKTTHRPARFSLSSASRCPPRSRAARSPQIFYSSSLLDFSASSLSFLSFEFFVPPYIEEVEHKSSKWVRLVPPAVSTTLNSRDNSSAAQFQLERCRKKQRLRNCSLGIRASVR